MFRSGTAEIIIVLVIIILLFGPGRIAKVAKELGQSITAFKEGLNGGKNEPEETEKKEE